MMNMKLKWEAVPSVSIQNWSKRGLKFEILCTSPRVKSIKSASNLELGHSSIKLSKFIANMKNTKQILY